MKDFFLPLFTFTFSYPWMLLVPFLLWWLAAWRQKEDPAIAYPSEALLSEARPSVRQIIRDPLLRLLSAAIVLFLAIAAARPQKIEPPKRTAEARNIILAIDISLSMSATDFESEGEAISRLTAVKEVVRDFISDRPQDRLGLVVFGESALVQAPLTLDHGVLLDFLKLLEVGVAGNGTAVGDGLGLSLKRIAELQRGSKAVILLTDGVSNAGHVNPIKAAQVARDLAVKVHTIGMGTNRPVRIVGGSGFLSGAQVTKVEFDEKTLKEIAEITGGVYFHATSFEGLKKVYAEIDKLESTEQEDIRRSGVTELYPMYVLTALALYLLYIALTRTVFLKIP